MARPIVMPSLGMYTAEGTLTEWLHPAGEHVEAGEPIVEITTEKATHQIEAPDAGIIHQIARIGDNLPVQALIGYILAVGESPPLASSGPAASAPVLSRPSAIPPKPLVERPAIAATAPLTALPSEVRASPVARRLAAQHGIDLGRVVGSGPSGRIVEADVQAAITRGTAEAATTSAPAARLVRQRIPLVGMRRTIAERLRQSLSATASVTLTREVDAEAFVVGRHRLAERINGDLPYDALFIKLLATALRERPELNAIVEPDAILLLDEINVGFAVAVPGGLIVPIIHRADERPLAEIAAAVRDLSEKARKGGIRPEGVSGGTITITNLGRYGVDAFTPIINPPQAAILGIGRILARPAVHDGQLTVRQTCVLSLTFDHRVTDGVPAALLLDDVVRQMQDEETLAGLG